MSDCKKVIVVGLDGMEPNTTKRMVAEGKMPNVKKLIELGASREDLGLLGAMPTITPAQWTTLACGCYPNMHGITDFWNQDPEEIDTVVYGLDSRKCKAEQMWNVTAEAGKKTLVWQWPGSSWPPSSDSENLFVVDGTQPATVNYSIANVDMEKYIVASKDIEELVFIDHRGPKNLGDAATDCVIDKLDLDEDEEEKKDGNDYNDFKVTKENRQEVLLNRYKMRRIKNVDFHPDRHDAGLSKIPFDRVESPIGQPNNWGIDIPEGALEFSTFTAGGQLRRPCLILKNAAGEYDTVVVYKTKKTPEPLCALKMDGQIVKNVVDVCVDDKGEKVDTARWFKLLELAPDGSKVRMWMSTAFKNDCDDRWSPKSIYQEITQNCGYTPPFSQMGGTSIEFAQEILTPCWRENAMWQANAIKYMIHEKDLEVVFSHHHFIDHSAHQFWNFALQKPNAGPEELWQEQIDRSYQVADEYIGQFLPLLDEGWTIIVTSDHGEQIHDQPIARIGFSGGVSAGLMRDLGWTVMKKDENGEDTMEIDFAKTKAVAIRSSYIWINLKGRNPEGIVDPSEKYDLEEEIITSLYNYRDKEGNRVISMVFHNKDAKLLGLDGPDTGDLIVMPREHFVSEHGRGLSTYEGAYGTSVSPIFIAAGQGVIHDEDVKRYIRQVDVAPTIAALLDVRYPKQCEGAPAYQILERFN